MAEEAKPKAEAKEKKGLRSKYNDEVKAKCVQRVKEGVPLAKITDELGPNPKAIGRYCAAAGVEIPKQKRAKKEPAKVTDEKAEAPKKA